MLGRTVEALLATDYPATRFEIVVVDDAADAQTRCVLNRYRGGTVDLKILTGTAGGAAAARNLGAAQSSGEFLVFVDDDIVVSANHLTAQLETRAVYGECISGADWLEFTSEVLAELQASPVGRYRLAIEHGYRKPGTERWSVQVGLATAHFTLRRSLFYELGRFNEAFPRAGVEDWDFCLRATEAGQKLILDRGVILLHNDTRLTFSQLCAREEWRGVSVGMIAHMRASGYRHTEVMRENAPLQPNDPFVLKLRKGVKGVLGAPMLLRMVHAGVAICERLLKPERLLHRLYTAVISVHYLRGFRTGLAAAAAADCGPTGRSKEPPLSCVDDE